MISSIDALMTQLESAPEHIVFGDVIALIDRAFDFTPTAFTNGQVNNPENQNNGSCKLLALGHFLALTNEQTLALFGDYYRQDVLMNPDGTDHANIRHFMVTGHAEVSFQHFPLKPKKLF